MRKGAIGNIDVEIAAKVGMNWEPAILLLFSIPYKLREQSMHERIHPKVLRGIQSLSFFIIFGISLDRRLNFLLTSVYKSTASSHPLHLGTSSRKNSGKGRSSNASYFPQIRYFLFFSKLIFHFPTKSLWGNKKYAQTLAVDSIDTFQKQI